MRLQFVSAPGGSAFMHELLSVVAHEVEQVLNESRFDSVTVKEGPLVGDGDDVFVVVPHEYFRVIPDRDRPSPEVRRRTIGLCVEHPGTATFQTTLVEARQLGACVDINDDSAVALCRAGVPAERFHLGYSSMWDRWNGASTERSRDAIYLATTDPRRNAFLTMDIEALDPYEVFMAMPPHEPMTRPRPDFFMGDEKWRLLADSQIILNLHRENSRSFEWVRALEAICNGCVVVSEHSTDHAPLVPGGHFISGDPSTLIQLARALLESPDQLAAIRERAYQFVRTELSMAPSARMLLQLAERVAAGRPLRSTRALPLAHSAQFSVNMPTRHSMGGDASPPADRVGAVVKLPVMPARGASTVDTLLLHPGSAAEWNDALYASDAEFVLTLDEGDAPVANAVTRLVTALTLTNADVAYGFVITPERELLSSLPLERDRIIRQNYMASASLWRRSSLLALGGWSEGFASETDRTWDLWRRLALSGGVAHLVARPLFRQSPKSRR